MTPAGKGFEMKMLLVALAIGTFAQGALAGQPDCRTIEGWSGRLACYDAAFPPKATKPPATDGSVPREDPVASEDARVAAKLKNICRGC